MGHTYIYIYIYIYLSLTECVRLPWPKCFTAYDWVPRGHKLVGVLNLLRGKNCPQLIGAFRRVPDRFTPAGNSEYASPLTFVKRLAT